MIHLSQNFPLRTAKSMDPDNDDPRQEELESLLAIFPEIQTPNPKDPFTFNLDLPIELAESLVVTFPPASSTTSDASGQSINTKAPPVQAHVDSRNISYLPALQLRISLPPGYPVEVSPSVTLSTTPPWLPKEVLKRLEEDGPRLWEESGRDLVAFTYIDHLQRAADDVFGTVNNEGTLTVLSDFKLAILDYDIKAKRKAFETETFDCGICLDPKKGLKCHKMLECGHIFCLECLSSFYGDAIEQGSIETVRCLTPNCAKEREAQARASQKATTSISPSELLQIGLPQDTVRRYVTLKYKIELESDKTTVYCPRQWCNGAARSERHKKPSTVDFSEIQAGESVLVAQGHVEGTNTSEPVVSSKSNKGFVRSELLAVCEDCSYAFCSNCFQSWHGEYVICRRKQDTTELTEEEKATLEYIQLHTSPCPTCNAPAQKTHGCNHMICSRCNSHFCYLCSAWLDPGNPYRHYNKQPNGKVTACYMRLWELEGGDGDDVGIGFHGGPAPPVGIRNDDEDIAQIHPVEIVHPEVEEPESDDELSDDGLDDRHFDEHGRRIEVAMEAPLVLRVMDPGHANVPPAAPAAPPAVPRAQEAQLRANLAAARGRGRGRGRGGGGGGRGRGRGARRGTHVGQPVNENALDAAQQAWIRNFVQMALRDEEDQVEGDSDDDVDDERAVNWEIS